MRPCDAAAIGTACAAIAGSRVTSVADQAALAARGQRAAPRRCRVVGHQRADRAEGLDVVHRVVGQRRCGTAAASARRRRRRATPSPTGAKPSRGAEHDLVAAREQRDALGDVALLVAARPARPCARPRPSDRRPRSSRAARAARSPTASRCWRGTIARRIAVHFWPALTVISRATSLTNRSNSSSSGVTSGARMAQFSESASALNGIDLRDQVAVGAQLRGGVGRAGEGDDVAARRAGRAGRRCSR